MARLNSTTDHAKGVYGINDGATGATYAVYGVNASTTAGAAALIGIESAATGASYGVYGESDSSAGFGGYFTNSNGGYALVTGSGNVGIGTNSPAAKLHVIGDIRYTGIIADVSDRRMKNDIRPLSSQLEKVTQLQACFLHNEGRPQAQHRARPERRTQSRSTPTS